MVRSIYLSGGITLLPNFPERLESELDRLTPSHLVPKVPISLSRYLHNWIDVKCMYSIYRFTLIPTGTTAPSSVLAFLATLQPMNSLESAGMNGLKADPRLLASGSLN